MQDTAGDGARSKLREAVKLHGAGRNAEAERLYNEIVGAHPVNADAWHLLGVVAYQRRDFAAAVERIRTAIAISDQDPAYHSNLGLALHAAGSLAEAIQSYRRAVELHPDYADAHYNLGNALQQSGDLDGAASAYRRAVSLKPDFVEAHNNLGNVLRHLGRLEDAVASYRAALALQPRLAATHNNLGNILKALQRWDDAIASYRQALALKPDFADAWNNLGNALQQTHQTDDAIAYYRRAIGLRPEFTDAWNNVGSALQDKGQFADAEAAFRRAAALDPRHVTAHFNLAFLLEGQERADEALTHYDQVLALDPEHEDARLRRFRLRLSTGDWSGFEPDIGEIRRRIASSSTGPIVPYLLAPVPGVSAADQRRVAESYARRRFAARRPDRWMCRTPAERARDARLRIGYLSSDFREHAVAYLLAEIIELHDRSRFDVLAYSLGPDGDSAMRRRLCAAFDEMRDLEHLSVDAAAECIADDRIDILVDLNGYTGADRPEILALRPAPIQVNYLGYPGTMGASFIDYLIADRFICPPPAAAHYTEALACLPHSYQPNDRKRPIGARPERHDVGLPESGFVFCAFNATYKITPAVFGIWMTLLRDVPDAVLWLMAENQKTAANLRRAATAHGVAPERLVFAPRAPVSDHLARYLLADLFLDTLPYNAHTTASDALWAGVPVLTCAGETFAGRAGGSIVRAAGLPELVVDTMDDYARLARRLATDRDALASLRARLARDRLSCPLFDSTRTTRDLERLYAAMWRRHLAGEPPAPIDLEKSGSPA